MADKMLIDASHKEETRVVVTRGNRIEEFDFESEHKKQLKGNIYLARVTRVEPSLQAAFVEYGGNRHGFLAFSEIHPDYYQIPVADRQALVEAEAQEAKRADEREMREDDKRKHTTQRHGKVVARAGDDEIIATEAQIIEDEETAAFQSDGDDSHGEVDEENIEIVGAEDALEEVAHYSQAYRRDYKIQEVIKRRQILLVQVVKEERGNKGAALTTYLSLAGRYSVLMPNTARGGGISRKITNVGDRKRLKEVVSDLEVPKGMGVILRTAGANRTKAEIRRDYEYLMRMWENVRALTLSSIAPALVYEEGSLIKRSIRDLYNKDIGEVLVAGEEGYREAKDFMRMLMPSHAKVVQPYREAMPIFARNGIEAQLDRMLQPEVSLKAGGYLVINQTEALVAIDVNSGRATKEHSVEETALQTNLEAAEEIARQLRLRDLAGLVVIDFIDMDERRHIRAVEKKLKDCLKEDRARIQVGHISHFGLLEMSRQRLRASVLESTTQICPHCHGTGHVRSQSSLALHVVRSIEDYLLRHRGHNIIVRTPTETALYVLNHKRQMLVDFETRFGISINIEADHTLGTQHLVIDKGEAVASIPPMLEMLPPLVEVEEEEDMPVEVIADAVEDRQEERQNGNGRRRRNKKRGAREAEGTAERVPVVDEAHADEEREKKRKSRRRQGRRGRDYDGRVRLPWPEPVGAFAASALAMARHHRRVRYAPHAEPVGDFFALAVHDDKITPTREAVVPETIVIEPVTIESSVDQPDVPILVETTAALADAPTSAVKRSRRRVKSQPAEEAQDSGTEIVAVPEEATPAPETVSVIEETSAAPIKKTRGRSKKNVALIENIVDSIAVDGDENAAAVKPKRRRIVKSKTETAVEKTSTIEENNGESPAALQQDEAKKPIVVSSSLPTPEKPKRMGWWQRRGFF